MNLIRFIILFAAASCLLSCSSLSGSSAEGSEWDSVPDSLKAPPPIASTNLSPIEMNTVCTSVLRLLDEMHPLLPVNDVKSKKVIKIFKEHFIGKPYTLRVYDLPSNLILAFPNGAIRLHSSLLDTLNDDELAALMAHEFAHVELGHAKKRLEQAHHAASAVQKGVAAQDPDKPTVPSLGDSLETAIGIALVDTPYTATQEAEADTLALSTIARTSIPIDSLHSALSKLQSSGRVNLYANVHPDLAARMQSLSQEATTYKAMLAESGENAARNTGASQTLLAQAAEEEKGPQVVVQNAETPCSSTAVASAYPETRTGWYVLSQPFKNRFDAELQTIDIQSMATDFKILRLGKTNPTHHIFVGPFYKKEYAQKNFDEFRSSGIVSSTSCIVRVKGKTPKEKTGGKAKG